MANDISYLTCDDADGLVAMLYLVLNKDKVFKSFCPGNIFYHNGKLLPMPDLDNPEGLRKYSLFSELEKDLLFK